MRRILASALVAFVAGIAVLTLVNGYSSDTIVKLLQFLAVLGLGVCVVGGVVVLALVQLGGWRFPVSEDEFEQVVRRAEELAARGSWGAGDDYDERFDGDADVEHADDLDADDQEFQAIVRAALDELPIEFHRALEHVAIVVSDGGDAVPVARGRSGAYGLYQGDTVTRDYFHDRIVIFRDTLLRDFGHEPELLQAQVTRTVRHELAHHLGWGERGVRDLGL